MMVRLIWCCWNVRTRLSYSQSFFKAVITDAVVILAYRGVMISTVAQVLWVSSAGILSPLWMSGLGVLVVIFITRPSHPRYFLNAEHRDEDQKYKLYSRNCTDDTYSDGLGIVGQEIFGCGGGAGVARLIMINWWNWCRSCISNYNCDIT